MINFKDSSASPALTAIFLAIILLSCITSSFLNPIVFFYNKKKTSIAGLLFCVLSATDFATCLSWPSVLLYHASTIDLDKMTCTGSETAYGRQPQNCVAEATLTQLVLTTIMLTILILTILNTSTGDYLSGRFLDMSKYVGNFSPKCTPHFFF